MYFYQCFRFVNVQCVKQLSIWKLSIFPCCGAIALIVGNRVWINIFGVCTLLLCRSSVFWDWEASKPTLWCFQNRSVCTLRIKAFFSLQTRYTRSVNFYWTKNCNKEHQKIKHTAAKPCAFRSTTLLTEFGELDALTFLGLYFATRWRHVTSSSPRTCISETQVFIAVPQVEQWVAFHNTVKQNKLIAFSKVCHVRSILLIVLDDVQKRTAQSF